MLGFPPPHTPGVFLKIGERVDRLASAQKHGVVMGWVMPRLASAYSPTWLPSDVFCRVPPDTQLSYAKPQFVCTTRQSVWFCATVPSVAADVQVSNRPGRQLRAEDCDLDWKPFQCPADLVRLVPEMLTLKEPTPYSLIAGDVYLQYILQEATLQHLLRAIHHYDALSLAERSQKPPMRARSFPELEILGDQAASRAETKANFERVRAADSSLTALQRNHAAAAAAKADATAKRAGTGADRLADVPVACHPLGRPAHSKGMNPSLHSKPATLVDGKLVRGQQLPSQSVAEAELEYLPFLPNVNEVSADGSMLAHLTAQRATRPLGNKPVAHLNSVPASIVPAATAPATAVPATTVPATAVPATGTAVPAATVPATAAPAAAVPATAVPAAAVPATAVPATAVPATAAALPAIAADQTGCATRYESLQGSDVGTDTLLNAMIRSLENRLYTGEIADQQEAADVIERLCELHNVDLMGGGLHFLFHVVQFALIGGWDHAGFRAWKAGLGRTDFDPAREAQQLRRKLDYLRLKTTAWFSEAARAFHSDPSVADSLFPEDGSASTAFDHMAYVRGFYEWLDAGEQTGDVEFCKHAQLVMRVCVPLLELVDAQHWGEFESLVVLEKYFVPYFVVHGKDKYVKSTCALKLKAAMRSALTNAVVANHISNSVSTKLGKLLTVDHLQEIHVQELGSVFSSVPQPERWGREMVVRSLNLSLGKNLIRHVSMGSWAGVSLGRTGGGVTPSARTEVKILTRWTRRAGLLIPDPRRTLPRYDYFGAAASIHVLAVRPDLLATVRHTPAFSYVCAGAPPLLLSAAALQSGSVLTVSTKVTPGTALHYVWIGPTEHIAHGAGGDWREDPERPGCGIGCLTTRPAGSMPALDLARLRVDLPRARRGTPHPHRQPPASTLPPCLSGLRLRHQKWSLGPPGVQVHALAVSWMIGDASAAAAAAAAAPASVLEVLPEGTLLTHLNKMPIDELLNPKGAYSLAHTRT